MSGEEKKTKGLYMACAAVSLGGGLLFFMLMLAAQEAIRVFPELAPHAGDIAAYCWGSLLPCLGALSLFVLVIREIAKGRAFSQRNARYMRWIGAMAFLECAYLMAGCAGYMCIGLMHPGVMLIVLALVLLGSGIGLLAWALARLAGRAGELQQENDLTV